MQPHPTPNQDETNAHYQSILRTLIDQAAEIATAIHRRALTPTPTQDAKEDADPTIAFDRIARTIRRTIALSRHLAENRPAPQNQAAARARLIRGVEDAIHRKHRESGGDSLYAELAERLEDPALEFDLTTRTPDELIEEICRDLGINTQGRSYVYKRRTPDDIATLNARAKTPLYLVPPDPPD